LPNDPSGTAVDATEEKEEQKPHSQTIKNLVQGPKDTRRREGTGENDPESDWIAFMTLLVSTSSTNWSMTKDGEFLRRRMSGPKRVLEG
jgi:hypothetical protein